VSREVKQYHFKAWPDKDVPDNAWCFVDFWRAVNTHSMPSGPIIVHCRYTICEIKNSCACNI